MKWQRLPGDVYTRSYRGNALVVMRTVRCMYHSGMHGRYAGHSWAWNCRGQKTAYGIEHTRQRAQQAAEAATRKRQDP